MLTRFTNFCSAVNSKFSVEDPIKRAYLRTNFLFALSVLVTWIPSSLNRIHGWVAGSSPFAYHMASATVLPLQGLWNGIIFFVTSWPALKAWYQGVNNDQTRNESVNRTAFDNNRPFDGSGHISMYRRDDIISDSDLEYEDGERLRTGEGSDVELTEIVSDDNSHRTNKSEEAPPTIDRGLTVVESGSHFADVSAEQQR